MRPPELSSRSPTGAHARAGGTSPGGTRREKQGLGWRLLKALTVLALYFVLEVVTKVVAVVQFVIVAWRGRADARLQRLGAALACFMYAMWMYITFASDRAPWPFSEWPAPAPGSLDDESDRSPPSARD